MSTTTTTARQELTRVTGTITSSDVPGCLLLDAQIRQYQLVGDRAAGLQPGTRMTVTGLADPNTPGACGNSIPLTVDEAVPAEE
ncbi:hypothetical protein [Actinophytocola oryzae]|uniref:hypothetical protein n=1 Tax=Actinophytocola oryzae TaxID=502181 RepID=UPI00106284A6|nr:hypothetical protein [Actinophytocola oryzae]